MPGAKLQDSTYQSFCVMITRLGAPVCKGWLASCVQAGLHREKMNWTDFSGEAKPCESSSYC